MSALKKLPMTPSPEAELDRQIEDLIRKLVGGEGGDHERESDLALLQDLQRKRVEMMRPKILKKREPA
jgi:hypothetical protein